MEPAAGELRPGGPKEAGPRSSKAGNSARPMAVASSPRVVARDVAVRPPGAREDVVSGVSLEIRRGEWVALNGPNGSGKTSLALAIAGLWPASRGTVTFEGTPIGPGGAAARRGIATVLQDPSTQLLQSSASEELAFTARNLGLAEAEVAAEVERWCRRLGLEVDPAGDPRRLAAGTQQLVLLAAALASRPRLLVADEPAAHLDEPARARLLAVIRDEVDRGLAVLWIGQDGHELAAADRTLELAPARRLRVAVPSPDVRPSSDATLLRLRIRPLTAVDGPRIQEATARTIAIAARGITALVGRNGVGKSVLLHAAAGVGDTGQVEVVWERPVLAPPLLATQFPEDQIFEERVEDEVTYAAVQRGVPREEGLRRAREAFVELGLPPDFGRRRPWTLSGGEKRLVSVLSALVAPTSLVVLDEPTAGLDPSRRAGLSGLLARSARTTAILVASQDGEWVAGLGAVVHRFGERRVGPDAVPQLFTASSQRPGNDLPSPSKKTD